MKCEAVYQLTKIPEFIFSVLSTVWTDHSKHLGSIPSQILTYKMMYSCKKDCQNVL